MTTNNLMLRQVHNMAISEKVKQDAAAKRAGMQSRIDRNLSEIAEHEASIAMLAASNVRLGDLRDAYLSDIPAPKSVGV